MQRRGVIVVVMAELLCLPEVGFFTIILLIQAGNDDHQTQVGMAIAMFVESQCLFLRDFTTYQTCKTRCCQDGAVSSKVYACRKEWVYKASCISHEKVARP